MSLSVPYQSYTLKLAIENATIYEKLKPVFRGRKLEKKTSKMITGL